MRIIPSLVKTFSRGERVASIAALIVFFISGAAKAALVVDEVSVPVPAPGGVYTEGVVGQPIAVNPVLSANPVDESLAALLYGKLGDFMEGVEERGDVYTVRLKEGLQWEDGAPLTSDDVVFTVNLIQNPDAQSPHYEDFEGVTVERVSEVRVMFTRSAPYVFFEDALRNLELLPRHLFAALPPQNLRLSDYNLEPVSSGPYRVEGFTKRRDGFITEYRLTRNSLYAGSEPFIGRFIVKFYENEAELVDAYERRVVDGFGVWSMPETSSTLRGVIDKIDTAGYYAVFFNAGAKTALGDKDIRAALGEALDRDELVENVFGLCPAATACEGESYAAPLDGPDPYETRQGERDLADASSALGAYEVKNAPLALEIAYPEVGFLGKTAEFIRAAWESAGVSSVQLVPLDNEAFMDRVVRERNYEAVLFGNVLPHERDLFPFWHSSESFYPGLNLANFSDKKVDALLADIRTEPDESKRAISFEKVVSRIVSESPAAFLYAIPYLYVHDERLQGLSFPERLVEPADRFSNVAKWYVNEARVLKTDK